MKTTVQLDSNTKFTKRQQQAARRAWVKALRSGAYKQGRGSLKKIVSGEDAYCCLGVACDLFNKKFPNNCKWQSNGALRIFDDNGYCLGVSNTSLPWLVRDWLGLSDEGGLYRNSKNQSGSLIHLNDTTKYSFKQIANLIEREPKDLIG